MYALDPELNTRGGTGLRTNSSAPEWSGMKHWMVAAAGLLWVAAVGGGLSATWRFENAPGVDLYSAPRMWPSGSSIPRSPGRPLLVLVVHPQCPCTKATIGELALIMARAHGTTDAHVLFYRPAGVAADWHETDLWRAATQIPGVHVSVDHGGIEQRRFAVMTSGHTLLYGADGALQFSGGITPARGHSGDNAGRTAISSLLMGAPSDRHTTFIFGCSLSNRCPSCLEASDVAGS